MVGDFTKKIIWLACLMLVLSTTFAFGQGIVSGSIAGTVTDPQKAVVVGAKVAARNVATNTEFKAVTNDQGYFSIRSIPIGTYHVKVEAANFKKLDVDGVVVATGVTADMGALMLALGSTAETVTVEGAAPLIETTTSQGSATFTSSNASDLPLNGGFDQLALFIPGVQTAGNAGIFSNSNGASFGANGQRGRSNSFQIDGQFNNDTVVSGPAIFFTNQDAIQEVQIVTNNFGVEYGRTSGATVNYVTKSGTNNMHGSGFEYFTGNWADALTHLENPANGGSGIVPRYVENRWGGALGGPIVPNKIFFFTSYLQDTAKGSSSPSVSSSVTPTPAGLATLETCFPTSPAVAALKAAGPFAVPQGSPSVLPGSAALVNLAGCSGVEFGNVTRSLPAVFNDYEAVGRVDFVLSPRDQLFFRYLFTQNVFGGSDSAPGQDTSAAASGTPDDLARNQQAALDWTRNWSTHLVNQVRFSYVRAVSSFQNGGFLGCTPASLSSCPPYYNIESGNLGFGQAVNLAQGGLTNNSQWQDNASWQHGRHLVKFGGEYDRQRAPNTFLPFTNGYYTFSSAGATGVSAQAAAFNAFLAQNPNLGVSLTNGNPTIPFKEQDAALYLGDDWRIRENLTLNLGIRWEFNQQGINLLAAQTLARQLNPATAFWNTALPTSLTAVQPAPNHYDHFAPNFGFAWTPHMFEGLLGHDKTVIRGGIRLSYDPAFYNIFLNVASAAPAVNSGAFACPAPCFFGLTGGEVKANLTSFLPTGGNPGVASQTHVSNSFTNPYAEEATLGIQREITSKLAAEVRWVGTHTVHEFQTVNGNPQLSGLIANGFSSFIPAGVTECNTPGTPGYQVYANCNFRLYRLRENGASAHYNALQSQLKFQNWHGFTAVAAYTWSQNQDNASEIFSTYGPGAIAGPQNPYCPGACERAPSALDYPQNFTLFWQYELPFGKGQTNLMGKLLGGWALGGTYHYTSGQPWTPFEDAGTSTSCNDAFNLHFFFGSSCRPFLGGASAPVTTVGVVCNGLAATGTTPAECPNGTGGILPFGTIVSFFDPCLSSSPACGVVATTKSAVRFIVNDDSAAKLFGTPYGNMQRNSVRGQTVNTININLIKNTRVSEKVNLKLEGNVYNLFNHPFLGVPCADISECAPSFGGYLFNDSGGFNGFSGSGPPNAIGTGLAQRRLVLGAHIIF
ncbi:MAG: TonB-dependent receptor domain-containing protein [Terriglobales bacterium]